MLPYSRGLILDNTNNYGIVKTETVFGFAPSANNKYVNESFDSSEPLEWIITHGNFQGRSLQEPDEIEGRKLKKSKAKLKKKANKKSAEHGKSAKKKSNKLKRKAKGVKKCIFKILKKGDGDGQGGGKRKRYKRRGGTFKKMQKKFLLPLILGLMAAKGFLLPIALKALAFLSAKGLVMAFFSTVMASVLSLKGMFDHNHGHYQNRKDDTKTQVEIIQVPTKSEDHVYYDDHYRRGDLIPVLTNVPN